MNPYIGHENQLAGVEEYQLIGGKGNGMRFLQVKNGKGLEFAISADRCADISKLSFLGKNMSYLSPCGYVAPTYYDDKGAGFLKSFTAGFLTTCGLNSVGAPCEDKGETLPLHGTIGNTPAEHLYWTRDENSINIFAEILDEGIFSHKLRLNRSLSCSLNKNEIILKDVIKNTGDAEYPAMILYHLNMGYPLLSEAAELYIPSTKITSRDEHAQEGIDKWSEIFKPQSEFIEQCYFHEFNQSGIAGIFNHDIGIGLKISFDAEKLPYFTQWKMMGIRDYILGLEPGNCHPDGRDKMREEEKLVILKPNEEIEYEVKIEMIDGINEWNEIKGGTKC